MTSYATSIPQDATATKRNELQALKDGCASKAHAKSKNTDTKGSVLYDSVYDFLERHNLGAKVSGCLMRDVDEGLQRRAGNFLGAMETLSLGHGGSGYTTAALAELLSCVTDLNKSGLEISNQERRRGAGVGKGWMDSGIRPGPSTL